jgi:hypothetical protein
MVTSGPSADAVAAGGGQSAMRLASSAGSVTPSSSTVRAPGTISTADNSPRSRRRHSSARHASTCSPSTHSISNAARPTSLIRMFVILASANIGKLTTHK